MCLGPGRLGGAAACGPWFSLSLECKRNVWRTRKAQARTHGRQDRRGVEEATDRQGISRDPPERDRASLTGKYWNTKEAGTYKCVCCGTPLFDSTTKFDSGCGWPSFWKPLNEEGVTTETDRSLGMVRTEVTCSNCGADRGHVFDDGPGDGPALLHELRVSVVRAEGWCGNGRERQKVKGKRGKRGRGKGKLPFTFCLPHAFSAIDRPLAPASDW